MNKRVFTIMIALLLAAFVPKAYGQAWDGKTTTEVTPSGVTYTITTGAQLAWVAKQSYFSTFKGKTINLAGNIDLGGKDWSPIDIFEGTFDGCGYTISGLNVSATGNAGLFAKIDVGGIVKNLGVKGTSETTGNAYAGGIAGSNYGIIQNCYTSVTVTASGSSDYCAAGGIAGNNSGTIQDCYITGAVTCEKGRAGGIAGSNANNGAASTIQYCYATGAIKGNQAGGITGNTSIGGSILNCIALNESINGKGDAPKVGRITGYRENNVTTLTANHAAPYIPGTWVDGDKVVNGKSGADLPATFGTDGAGEGAFAGWETANWDFTTASANLPQVNTDGGASMNGQPTSKSRTDYLEAPTIKTQKELAAIASDLSGSYKLGGNITLTGDWTPLGEFTGTLDGNGKTISGLNVSAESDAGLFAKIGAGGTVKNLGVIGSVTTGNAYAGGIAGQNFGTIQNCYTSVEVTVNSTRSSGAGGIAGFNNSTIQNCYTTGAVTNEKGRAGGIAGYHGSNDGNTIQYCYATGAIKGNQAGGIAGESGDLFASSGNILNCITLNNSITGTTSVGRIVGSKRRGTLTANYAAPSIPGVWKEEDKGADTDNGDDLTEDNFTGAGATAFTGWNTTTDWDFTIAPASLPQVKANSGNVISGQTASKPRADYLEAPVTTITTKDQLADIKKDPTGSYKLGGNIDLTDANGETWTPIAGTFTGTLDGCGFTISGLKVSVTVRAGLFGYIGKNGTVKNLGVTGTTVTVTGDDIGGYAGGIAGYSEGTIQNCYTNVAVTAASSTNGAGGIVGNNDGTILNCYTTGAVTNEKGFAGGIAGKNTKDIQYCYATGAIKGNQVGGISGSVESSDGKTLNCIALNDSINGKGDAPKVGRITGYKASIATLTANHAALSIPGVWTGKGANTENGADLPSTFDKDGAGKGAFTGWNDKNTSNWNFSDLAKLPQVNTDGGTSISGQTASKPRADYLEAPVTTITTQAQLADIEDNLTGSYKLGDNITLEGDWTPIAGEFTGTLDGCGYVISGLKVSVNDDAGLFGYIGTGGTVKNLGVTDGSVTAAYASAGSIASENRGTIQNCYTNVTVTVSLANNAGGIAGKNIGTIQNCYTTGAVTSEKGYAGGIAGKNEWTDETNTATIQYCYATGVIKGYQAGGISGNMSDKGQILNCIALNDSIKGSDSAGRILGYNDGGTLTANHAALSIPGVWEEADKGADTENGADLIADTFTGTGANKGAFTGWNTADWAFGDNTNLPILKDFKTANQPVKERKPFLEVPVTTITTKGQLADIASNLAGSYKLGNDIDLKDVNWNPIGDKDNPFTGTLDGCGYVIRNLTIKIEVGFEKTGLFHTIGEKGTVKNLGVTGNITAGGKTGGITGENYGIIQNCYTNVKVTSPSAAGGIAGVNFRIIQNCYTTGAVTSDQEAGGIAGANMGGDNTATIQNCYATGAIKGYQAGGITGKINTENTAVTNCIALNDSIIGIDKDPQVGRIAGVNMDSGTLYENHAALSIPGAWAADDKAIDKKNGADLPSSFGTDKADTGFFAGWEAANWNIETIYIPFLQGFKTADQPVNKMEREPFLKVPVTTIKDQAGLAAIASNLSGSYKLGGSFTLTGNWKPLGDNKTPFTGTLDGCGYTISGLNVSMTETDDTYAGLFGYIGEDGTVKNLGVTGSVTITASSPKAGGIAGWSDGKITNCYTNVTVSATGTGFTYAGGIAGYLLAKTATISNCFAIGNCTASSTDSAVAGGIVGGTFKKECSINYCYATGAVEAKGEARFKYAGGIVGRNPATVTGCIALNKSGITGASGTTNRIVTDGDYSHSIIGCYASPAIPGTWSNIGADKLDGADLTSANFINSNSAFTGWNTADWAFGDNTNLPTLMTTGLTPNIALAGQTVITRMGCLNLVLIEGAVTYDATKHGGKHLCITSTGNLTVNTSGAQVDSLEIQPGGQVTTTTALGVTKAMSTSRTLANKWSTFGAPILMKFKAIEKGYMLQGYASSEAEKQQWTEFDLPSSTVSLQAASPYLLAIDKGNETVSFSSVAGTPIPVSAKAESGSSLSNGIFLFRMNPSLSNQTLTNVYILSEDGTRFERQATYTLKPFECYVIANAATAKAVQSLRVGNGTPTGNAPIALTDDAFRLWGANGQLHLSADTPHDVAVYTLSGRLVRRFTLTGEETLALPRGIYLVNSTDTNRSTNITYKVSL